MAMENHGHSHSHSHSRHDHGHSHSHAPSSPGSYNFAFGVGIGLNFIFVLIEAVYGFLSNSMALVADAGHNLGDVVGLALAWIAVWLSQKRPSGRFTYGLRRSSILSALTNAVLLLIAVGGILVESVRRLLATADVQTSTVIAVASIGIVINAFTALLFMSGRKGDINIRGAYLHMAADALVSIGVVIAALVIRWTHWEWLDPAVSIFIGFVIVFGTWGLLKDSIEMAMDAVPRGVDIEKVREYLKSQSGVGEVHDLHIWAMSTTETAMTVHLVVPQELHRDGFLAKLSKDLKERFHIDHPTIQIEAGDVSSFNCALKPDEVV